MRPDMVAMLHPLPNNDPSFFKTAEDSSIKQIVSKGIVKTFTKAILPGATGFNVCGFHPNTGLPTAQLFGNKFWVVVHCPIE